MTVAASMKAGSGGTTELSGELVFSTVGALALQAGNLPGGKYPSGKIDLREVSRVDSSGLALLLEWQSRAKAAGGGIVLLNAPDDLARLARLCEAEGLLQLSNQESTDQES